MSVKNSLKYNSLINPKKLAHIFGLFLMLGFLSSCQSSSSSLSETVVSHSAKMLREAAIPAGNIHRDETIVLLGDSAAVFFVVLTDNFPKQLTSDLTGYLNQRLEKLPMFQSVRGTDDLNLFFKKNHSLNQLRDVYLESLARVSVSNKDISNSLGKHLNVKNFVVFQVDRWPCSDCKAPFQIRIKLRLIDAATGFIFWNGINEITLDDIAEITLKQVIALSDELLITFQDRFQRKWHRLRFQNLGLLAKNSGEYAK
ncbi:MAG: hypothetical protein HQ517_15010 [SAR324 cluster bacterium]|nr:hypothetical protein [SAR324 cluster bacterium]